MDTQDVFAWGDIKEEKVNDEGERIQDLCAQWGPSGSEVMDGKGFDGFVRMEVDL
jgi:hypothetical protein